MLLYCLGLYISIIYKERKDYVDRQNAYLHNNLCPYSFDYALY